MMELVLPALPYNGKEGETSLKKKKKSGGSPDSKPKPYQSI